MCTHMIYALVFAFFHLGTIKRVIASWHKHESALIYHWFKVSTHRTSIEPYRKFPELHCSMSFKYPIKMQSMHAPTMFGPHARHDTIIHNGTQHTPPPVRLVGVGYIILSAGSNGSRLCLTFDVGVGRTSAVDQRSTANILPQTEAWCWFLRRNHQHDITFIEHLRLMSHGGDSIIYYMCKKKLLNRTHLTHSTHAQTTHTAVLADDDDIIDRRPTFDLRSNTHIDSYTTRIQPSSYS